MFVAAFTKLHENYLCYLHRSNDVKFNMIQFDLKPSQTVVNISGNDWNNILSSFFWVSCHIFMTKMKTNTLSSINLFWFYKCHPKIKTLLLFFFKFSATERHSCRCTFNRA
jgi:hypothetical protein